MDDELLLSHHGTTAVLTMNRPDRRNALSRGLRRLLHEHLHELDADDEVRAIVLTGTDPAFCGGLDLRDLQERVAGDDGDEVRGCPIPALQTPLIGAVNGPAVTGGLEVALHCDILVASEQATFADTHARVGLISTWGLATLLPRRVGRGKARAMSMTGAAVPAAEALAAGLVEHVVPHDELLPFCLAIAEQVALAVPGALTRMLELYDDVDGLALADGIHHELEAGTAWATAAVEAVLAARARRGQDGDV